MQMLVAQHVVAFPAKAPSSCVSFATLPYERRAVGGCAKGKPPRLTGSDMGTGGCGGGAAGGPTLDNMFGDRMANTCAIAGWLSSSTLWIANDTAWSAIRSPTSARFQGSMPRTAPCQKRGDW
jgi:hypothetical protein